jgi:hypothetical protein
VCKYWLKRHRGIQNGWTTFNQANKVYQQLNEEHKHVIDIQTGTQIVDLAVASRELRKNRKTKQDLLKNHEGHRRNDLKTFTKEYESKGQEDQALIVRK